MFKELLTALLFGISVPDVTRTVFMAGQAMRRTNVIYTRTSENRTR
ncbi:hypothetical protein I546_3257 [Mycobacterium kansasii 732]|nr:hypothetical protein I546_3257 [Mycobacterium kansasii 732]